MILSRLSYVLRETLASFRRNVTLTAAAIITAAVSLLIFGITLFMQHGFDNLLVKWEGGVEVIVYVNPGASDDQLAEIEKALDSQSQIESYRYLGVDESLDEAKALFAGDPNMLSLLGPETIPTQFKVIPTDASDVAGLNALNEALADAPSVQSVVYAKDDLDVISKLKGFVGLYTVILSIALLVAAILLIWNTIRTAMFARRREIEVMKLVGATDWFIRVPFMLEGLIQGLLGGVGACAALWVINNRWTAGVAEFPFDSGFAAMVVGGAFQAQTMLVILVIGAAAGAIGSGIAASRFLDV